jgi:hypothetical protein
MPVSQDQVDTGRNMYSLGFGFYSYCPCIIAAFCIIHGRNF